MWRSGMKSALTASRLASQHTCETSWEQRRMRTRCSVSSAASTLCLYVLTSVAPFGSTRLSWYSESRTTLKHSTKSSRSVYSSCKMFDSYILWQTVINMSKCIFTLILNLKKVFDLKNTTLMCFLLYNALFNIKKIKYIGTHE